MTLPRGRPHAFVAGLQLFAPQSATSFATVHGRHTRLTQRGLPATFVQSVSTMQPSHAFEAGLQRLAVALVHEVSVHVHVAVAPTTSQAGCAMVVHAPRSVVVQMAQVCDVVLQAGVAPMQFAALTHPTH
jgi:hypothetical protein